MPDTHVDAGDRVSLLTVAGMAALVYVASVLLHEAGGHGLACLAVGGRPLVWGAYYFNCDARGLPPSAARIISAAGSTVNLIVALSCLTAWRRVHADRGTLRLLLWLAFTINAFEWAGYFLFSGVSGFGDWGTDGVLAGVPAATAWRVLLVAVGAVFYYWWTMSRSARMLGAMLGGTEGARRNGRRACMTAYVVGGVISVAVGLLNPLGIAIVIGSAAAASLGGTIGLVFVALSMPRDARSGQITVGRKLPWMAVGLAAAVAYAVVFGPSVVFAR